MNIFDFAMEKEKFSENYYRQLAGRIDVTGLHNIFLMLADEEAKHYRLVEAMKAGSSPDLAETSILADAKKIFASFRDAAEQFDFDITQLDLYNKAKEIERQARKFYLEKGSQVPDPRQKEIFLKLADEEQKHYALLENIIEFVSRPQQWLENAEWYHLDTY